MWETCSSPLPIETMKIFATRRIALVCLSIIALAGALVVSGCGSDSGSSSPSSAGNAVDLAFVQDMIPHHESAVAMAKTARQRSKRATIKNLADDIVQSQATEITQMRKIAAALKADGVKSGDLGVSEHLMGMSMDETALETADPFDREFIDMMVPHHQGAIRMARVVLAKGESTEVKKLARAIIGAQSREIGAMNGWRKRWYGAASPAGGVPAMDRKSDDGNAMNGHGM